ncbi:HEPN domain-containing protein [Candidatus Caldatribacterium sp. SIUC1]|uniref:HEPN domain-containing protein n=1 Tax=Candidatus Caldatribacterium sp. SIUC1 TaxID=3418365 RepID=UPI003F68E5D4
MLQKESGMAPESETTGSQRQNGIHREGRSTSLSLRGKIALQDRGSTGIWYNKAMRRITLKWLKQAEADLRAAWDSYRARHYGWSYFQAQQSEKKALKAYLYEKGYTSVMTHLAKGSFESV